MSIGLIQDPSALDPTANRLLAQLSRPDLERLRPHLEAVEMSAKTLLFGAGDVIDYAYFPITGMTSTVVASADGMSVEAACVGREGTTGLPLHLGSLTSPLDQVQQIPGAAVRMRAEVFCAELGRREALFEAMQRYGQYVHLVMAQTIVCNRLHDVPNRAARWLLMSHDAVDGDSFQLTQEYFATMLGVHRPSVTLAAITLQGAGAISYRRGVVTVIDREYLEELACECYANTRREQVRLLGGSDGAQLRRTMRSLPRADGREPSVS